MIDFKTLKAQMKDGRTCGLRIFEQEEDNGTSRRP